MTTSIPLRVFIFTSALKNTSEKGENWWRELRDIHFSMIAEKPRKIKVFQRWASKKVIRFRVLHLRPLGQLSVYVIPHFFQKLLERTDGKNNKIFNFRTGENPVFMGFLSGANSQLYKKFRVSPVMTASIRFHIRLKHGKTRFAHTILSVLKEKVKRFLAKRLTYTGQCGYNNCVLWCLDLLFSHG